MVKKVIKKFFLWLLLILFISSAAIIAHQILQGYFAQKNFDHLEQVQSEEGIITDKGYIISKYAALWKKNSDIIGWIKIKDTKIDYPVMQTQKDPEFYLRRNFEKKYEISGTPFMDSNSDVFIPTTNWLIYGHNMYNGIMFHDLLKYEEEDFYKKHKTIRFDTIYLGGQAEYEVIAAFKTRIDTSGFRYFEYAGMTSEEDYRTYVENVKKLTPYTISSTANYGDQLITLSTCSYHVEDKKGRFVVVAKKVRELREM